MKIKKIIIFASGSGSNAQCILNHFKDKTKGVVVSLIVTNRIDAGVLGVAKKAGVNTRVISKEQLSEPLFLKELSALEPSLIVLAGFLLKIPSVFLQAFQDKIINIHPSLLPKYGGKGMYGLNVHKAVHDASEKESGLTIHWVNDQYDAGKIIKQIKCNIDLSDSPEDIANKVLALEHENYALTIEKLLKNEFEHN